MGSIIRSSSAAIRVLVAWAIFALSANVFAGEFFEPGGVAIRGYDPVAYFKESRAVQGSAKFTALHKGSLFRFSSAANRDAFAANPDRYVPQYGGFCAYAAALGKKAAADPNLFTVHNGRLYLNADQASQALWRKDIPGNIAKADKIWFEVVRQPHP